MFSVYTPTGVTFSGSVERLRRVEKTAHTTSARTTDSIENEFSSVNEKGYVVSQKANEQYRKLLAREENREPVYHAYQIMSTPVQAISEDLSINQALEQFQLFPYQVFPLINARRELVGILPRKKLYEYIVNNGSFAEIKNKRVGDCFLTDHSQVYTTSPVTDVRRITTLLVEKNLDALPVVEEQGTIVGMVSRTDILRCAITDPPLSLWC